VFVDIANSGEKLGSVGAVAGVVGADDVETGVVVVVEGVVGSDDD
jgi:hypothetical protein